MFWRLMAGMMGAASSVPNGTAWSPADASPDIWFRADLGHAFADTDPVTDLANQGTLGAALDLVDGTAGAPTYVASHAPANGAPALDFGAAAATLISAATTAWHLSSESSDLTVVAVARSTSASGAEEVVMTRAYSTNGGFRLRLTPAGACSFGVEENGGVTAILDSGANGAQNTVHVLAGVLTGAVTTAPDSAACWVDGVSAGATTGDLDAPVAASANRELLLGGTASGTGTFAGHIYEVLVWKRLLTADEDADLTAYLNARYGTSVPGVSQ